MKVQPLRSLVSNRSGAPSHFRLDFQHHLQQSEKQGGSNPLSTKHRSQHAIGRSHTMRIVPENLWWSEQIACWWADKL